MSKKEILNNLLVEVSQGMQCNKYWRAMLDGIETLNDFKSTIEWTRNHIECCEKQLNKYVQYHHGNQYYYHATDLQQMKRACITLCNHVGYEMYSPNGSWFVRSIK
jgi:hypothetical protein